MRAATVALPLPPPPPPIGELGPERDAAHTRASDTVEVLWHVCTVDVVVVSFSVICTVTIVWDKTPGLRIRFRQGHCISWRIRHR
eukprot:COSAG03_NODE_23117_length_283_cov_0.831522_1_plen_84_part_10